MAETTRTLEIEFVADSSRVRQELQEVRADAGRGATVPLRGPGGTLGGELPAAAAGLLSGSSFSPVPPPAYAGLVGDGGGTAAVLGGSATQQRFAQSKAAIAQALFDAVEAELGIYRRGGRAGTGFSGPPPVPPQTAPGFGPPMLPPPGGVAGAAGGGGPLGPFGGGPMGGVYRAGQGPWRHRIDIPPAAVPVGQREAGATRRGPGFSSMAIYGGLFAAMEGVGALRAYQDAELAAGLATDPMEAFRVRTQSIEQMTGGMFGSLVGLAFDAVGFGPASIRRELAGAEAVMAGQARTDEAVRFRREGLQQRAAFAGGGTSALGAERMRQEAKLKSDELQREIDRLDDGLNDIRTIAVGGGTGGQGGIIYEHVLSPEVRNQRTGQIAALRQQRQEIAERLDFDTAERRFQIDQQRAGIRAAGREFAGIAVGLPSDERERRSMLDRQSINRVLTARLDPRLLPDQDAADAAERAALSAVQAQANAIFGVQAAGAIRASNLRAAFRPTEAAVANLLADNQSAILAADPARRVATEQMGTAAAMEFMAAQSRQAQAFQNVAAPASSALRFQLLRNPLEAGLAGLRAERAGSLANVPKDRAGERDTINEQFDTRERILRQSVADSRNLQNRAISAEYRQARLLAETNPQIDRSSRRLMGASAGIFDSAVMQATQLAQDGRGDQAATVLQTGRLRLEGLRRDYFESQGGGEVSGALRIGSAGSDPKAAMSDIAEKIKELVELAKRTNDLLADQGLRP